ncbi:pectate lyase [Halalkalibacter urbisdiaboli]|uniref:pectate lyase n=1 Tax=Halalkalibacter urbisdiaboli TaxID=1960589 RepID=UPI000B442452|nr:pectate lyase [Halalkalibacter urbisdiaboli]
MKPSKRINQFGKISFISAFTAMSVMSAVPVPNGVSAEEADLKIVLESNFEQDETGAVPSGYTVAESGGTVRISEDLESENKSVYLDDTSEQTNVILSKDFEPVTGVVTFKMKFMQPEYTSATKVARIKGEGKTAVVIETNSGNLTYRHGDQSHESLITVEENKWYELEIVMDTDAQTTDVKINGEMKIEGAPFHQQTAIIDFFESFTPNSKTLGHYIDDVTVSGFPPIEEKPVNEEEPSPDKDEPATMTGVGIYEAEHGDLHNAIIDNKHVGFTGSGFVDYAPNAPGGYIEWTVDVPEDGEYTLDFRYAHGGTDKRPAEIRVNDEVVEAELPFDPSGDWANWITTSMKANLKAGKNVIRATGIASNGGANIDHVNVYKEVDIISEAEDAEHHAVIIDNKHIGFTGTGFADYNPNAPGGWIEWTVDIPATDEYTLEFRYAHGGTDKRPAEILVNGEVANPELAFDPTGDWAGWQTTTMKTILQAGKNVIRATGIASSGGANIDHLRIHNKSGDVEDVVELEEVELTEILSGLQMKKLNKLGLIASEQKQEQEPITRIEFMSLINDAFGFTKNDTFKNIELDSAVGEVSLDEWYSYVVEASEDAGYLPTDSEGNVAPNDLLNRHDAAVMIASVLNLEPNPDAADDNIPEKTKGAIGAVASNGYMNPKNGGFSPKKSVTVAEAKQIVERIVEGNEAKEVNVVGVHSVSPHIVTVTLNGYFEDFDFDDISIMSPTGRWETLSPGLKALPITKAAQAVNKFGQTVLVFESKQQWNENAKFNWELDEPTFSGDLEAAIERAENMVSWQMDHGGFSKGIDYSQTWDGVKQRSVWLGPNGEELGMIDNDATIKELNFLAQVYNETGDEELKQSIIKGIDFLFNLQVETGGFPQVYPERATPGSSVYYSNHVTFNDEAMVNVLELMEAAMNRQYPFNGDLISDDYVERLQDSVERGVDYILKSQIEVDGQLLGWSAQHDRETYEPRGGRSYEHPSLSGSEAVGIVRFLMSRPEQTPEIKQAILGALQWFDDVKLDGIRYVSADPNGEYFVEDPNAVTWYRFYEIGTNEPIFSGRDGVIKRTIQEIEKERRDGYSWGGNYAQQLLEVAKSTGYFEKNVYAQVTNTKSKDEYGRTLVAGETEKMEDVTKQLSELENELVVDQAGLGDYESVQAAIDAIPTNNSEPVTIRIKNGVYKEVIRIPANKPKVTLIGESAEETVITYDNYAGRENGVGGTLGTSGSATAFLQADDFTAENLTFENSFDERTETDGKQAVAVNSSGERMTFKNVRFLGNQDTLLTNGGTQYFYQSYIEGDVDFIFGGARAVFEDTVIHSLDRGSSTNNGYITAASTMITEPYGYLFLNCELTSDAAPGTVYLGRPWHPGGNPDAIASVVFMDSYLGDHIHKQGWTDMSGFSHKDARFYEYNNHGPGAIQEETDSRRLLTDEEAADWTIENVLKGWNPKAE